MSTIVVVKKSGYAAIAADTLTTCGNVKESAGYVVNHEKIVKYRDNYIGVSGSASLGIAVQDFLVKTKGKILLGNITEIFEFGLLLHKQLKDKYFLLANDAEDDFETFRGDILIANPNGIFGLSSYRFVQEYSKFYANGSGGDYALGAMFVAFQNSKKTAEEIAKIGIQTGAEFDDGTSLPMTCYTVKLK